MKLFIPPLGDFEDPLSSPLKQGWSAHYDYPLKFFSVEVIHRKGHLVKT